jgi:hypothetical protein
MNMRLIVIKIAAGAVVQIAMVVAGHFAPYIKDNLFAVGGMAISLIAGFAYARLAASGWGSSVGGGLLVGGVCALVGIALSVALGDVPAMILVMGTLGSAVTGAIGGAIGKLLV